MGRTLPPFRPALEGEIESWKGYRRALRQDERKFFDKIMDTARQHADAGSLSARPLISDIIFFSCLLEQQKQLETQSIIINRLEVRVRQLEDAKKSESQG